MDKARRVARPHVMGSAGSCVGDGVEQGQGLKGHPVPLIAQGKAVRGTAENKPLTVSTGGHGGFESQLPFWFPGDTHLGRQQVAAQGLGLPPSPFTGETWMEFWASA